MAETEEQKERRALVASRLPEDVVLRHLRLSPEYVDEGEREYILSLVASANAYVCDHCGVDQEYVDEHEDLAVAVLVLTADMYDERDRNVASSHDNRTLDTILSHHDHNLGGACE